MADYRVGMPDPRLADQWNLFLHGKIGIPNIGIAIILYTIIIYLVLTPLQIKQQKMSKMMSVMQPDLQRVKRNIRTKRPGFSDEKI